MICTAEELRRRIAPVAEKYGLSAVDLFGSYARNEATEKSDVDILIDRSGSSIRSMLDMGALYEDLHGAVGKEIDLITTQALEQESTRQRRPQFVRNIQSERIRIV